MTSQGLSLDSGAFSAFERGDMKARALIRTAQRHGVPLHAVPEVVAQVWRGGPRRAELARLLASKGLRFPVLDLATARAVGEICGRSGHSDIVDVHVVVDAVMNGHKVVTSDPDDLRRVDPGLTIIEI